MRSLDHIRWVAGGTGAGKTTVTRRLSEEFSLPIYSTDDSIAAHATRMGSEATRLERFRRMDMDERWVRRDPTAMYRTFPWFHGEGFDLLVNDLRALPTDQVTLVEGFRLLPHLVSPMVSNRQHAIWLIPTAAFRRAAFARRDGSEAFWLRTTDPQRALMNLLKRDELFADELVAAAARSGLDTMSMDGDRSLDATVAALVARFGLLP